MVEHELPKLAAGVRFPSPAPKLPEAALILSKRSEATDRSLIVQRRTFAGGGFDPEQA